MSEIHWPDRNHLPFEVESSIGVEIRPFVSSVFVSLPEHMSAAITRPNEMNTNIQMNKFFLLIDLRSTSGLYIFLADALNWNDSFLLETLVLYLIDPWL